MICCPEPCIYEYCTYIRIVIPCNNIYTVNTMYILTTDLLLLTATLATDRHVSIVNDTH
jgi:hypothetical protein